MPYTKPTRRLFVCLFVVFVFCFSLSGKKCVPLHFSSPGYATTSSTLIRSVFRGESWSITFGEWIHSRIPCAMLLSNISILQCSFYAHIARCIYDFIISLSRYHFLVFLGNHSIIQRVVLLVLNNCQLICGQKSPSNKSSIVHVVSLYRCFTIPNHICSKQCCRITLINELMVFYLTFFHLKRGL